MVVKLKKPCTIPLGTKDTRVEAALVIPAGETLLADEKGKDAVTIAQRIPIEGRAVMLVVTVPRDAVEVVLA